MAVKKCTVVLMLAMSPAMACTERMADTLLIHKKPMGIVVWLAEGIFHQLWWYKDFSRQFRWNGKCFISDTKHPRK
jgi:hypothetical protein